MARALVCDDLFLFVLDIFTINPFQAVSSNSLAILPKTAASLKKSNLQARSCPESSRI
jgi:hypothetical protein